MAAKDDRITFRTGDVRLYKLAEYKKRIENLTGKRPKNTDIMLKALDMLLDNEGGEEAAKIKMYEDIIIKLFLGIDRNSFKTKKAYIEILEANIERFKSILEE